MHDPAAVSPLHAAHRWVVEHDDRRLFIALYIGLAVVLSIWISLFWLLVIVGVHLLFELVRQAYLQRRPLALVGHALWEIKLDVALVLLALVLALYMELVLGVLGLNGAARMGGAVARAGARGVRFAAWERTLRGILLSADDAVQVLRVLARRGKQPPTAPDPAQDAAQDGAQDGAQDAPPPGIAWGLGDRISVALLVGCLALLVAAPWLTDHTPTSALLALQAELQPFPAAE